MSEPEETTAAVAPTFWEAIGNAASALAEARTVAGMDSAGRLTGIADSWLSMAHLIDQHDSE
jgi:hypothetical protein